MWLKVHSTSGVPIYLQLMEQIRHAVDLGNLQPGDQLPTIRTLAEELLINPNTVAKVYRELEHEGVVELKQGSGAFIRESPRKPKLALSLQKIQPLFKAAVHNGFKEGLSEENLRSLFENEILHARNKAGPKDL